MHAPGLGGPLDISLLKLSTRLYLLCTWYRVKDLNNDRSSELSFLPALLSLQINYWFAINLIVMHVIYRDLIVCVCVFFSPRLDLHDALSRTSEKGTESCLLLYTGEKKLVESSFKRI